MPQPHNFPLQVMSAHIGRLVWSSERTDTRLIGRGIRLGSAWKERHAPPEKSAMPLSRTAGGLHYETLCISLCRLPGRRERKTTKNRHLTLARTLVASLSLSRRAARFSGPRPPQGSVRIARFAYFIENGTTHVLSDRATRLYL